MQAHAVVVPLEKRSCPLLERGVPFYHGLHLGRYFIERRPERLVVCTSEMHSSKPPLRKSVSQQVSERGRRTCKLSRSDDTSLIEHGEFAQVALEGAQVVFCLEDEGELRSGRGGRIGFERGGRECRCEKGRVELVCGREQTE